MVIPFLREIMMKEQGRLVILDFQEGKLRIKSCFGLHKFETPVRHSRSVRWFEIGGWSSRERLELET